jgi:hypothetical protein
MDGIFTTTNAPTVTANLTPWPVSFILPDAEGQPMVTISLTDGTIEYGPTYEPDAAARVFWEAMQTMFGSPDAVFGHGLAGRVDEEMAELRQRAEKAEAAVERVRTIHHHVECSNVHCKTGGWCVGCDPTGSDDCSEHPWPCPTVLALDPDATLPDQYAAWVLKRDHDRLQAKLERVRAILDPSSWSRDLDIIAAIDGKEHL